MTTSGPASFEQQFTTLSLTQNSPESIVPPTDSFWKDIDIYCKCDCITPTIIPKDIPPLELPVISYLELTHQCNNSCLGCWYGQSNRGTSRRKILTAHQWEIIFSKLAGPIQRLQITGGEPTLHPEFAEIINLIEQLAIPYVIFTNALWSDPPRLMTFLEQKKHFNGFLISLHGANAPTHEAFTGQPGSFETTIQNIQLATQIGFSVFTSTVLFQDNFTQLLKIQGLAESLGARYSVYNRFVGSATEPGVLNKTDLKQAIDQIEMMRLAGMTTRFGNCIPQCFYPSSAAGCFAGSAFISIDASGNVKPCNHAFIHCGNLLTDSLFEVWDSANMQRWRNLVPAQCQDCAEFSNCHGGCRAVGCYGTSGQDTLIVENEVHKTSRNPKCTINH